MFGSTASATPRPSRIVQERGKTFGQIVLALQLAGPAHLPAHLHQRGHRGPVASGTSPRLSRPDQASPRAAKRWPTFIRA